MQNDADKRNLLHFGEGVVCFPEPFPAVRGNKVGQGKYRLVEEYLRTTVLISLNRGHLAGSPEPLPQLLHDQCFLLLAGTPLQGFPAPPPRGVYQTSLWSVYLSGTPAVSPNPFPWVASQARQVRGTTAGNLQIKFISRNTCGFPEPFPADLWETTRINFISGVPSAGRATQIKSPFTNTPENAKSCTQTCNKPQKFFKIPPRSPFFWTFKEKFGMKTGKKIPPDKWAERYRGMRAVNG